MNESMEARIGTLERQVATVEQRLENVTEDVRGLQPFVGDVIRLGEALANVRESVVQVRAGVQSIEDSIKARDSAATEERRAVRVALIGLTSAILVALIAAIATVLAAGIG